MIETIKSLRWADYFVYCITDPRRMATEIMEAAVNPLIMGAVTLFLVSLAEIITVSSLSAQTPFFNFKMSYGVIFLFLVMMVHVLVISSMVDLACQFSGLEGKVRPIISLVSLSLFPNLLILPLTGIFRVFQFAPTFFYVFFSIALAGWSIMIMIQGMSEMHRLDFSKSSMIFVLPFVAVSVLLFLMLVLTIIMFFGMIVS